MGGGGNPVGQVNPQEEATGARCDLGFCPSYSWGPYPPVENRTPRAQGCSEGWGQRPCPPEKPKASINVRPRDTPPDDPPGRGGGILGDSSREPPRGWLICLSGVTARGLPGSSLGCPGCRNSSYSLPFVVFSPSPRGGPPGVSQGVSGHHPPGQPLRFFPLPRGVPPGYPKG